MSSTATGARAAIACARNSVALGAHERMHDRLEFLQPAGLAYHLLGQRLAIDDAVRDGARKGLGDERRGGAAVERVHGGVGVVHRHAERPEHARRHRLSHADRAGEAEDEGHRPLTMSASIKARSAGVTFGVTPNQRPKPGTAWCSSMPSPSTARSARALAWARSGVSSGT